MRSLARIQTPRCGLTIADQNGKYPEFSQMKIPNFCLMEATLIYIVYSWNPWVEIHAISHVWLSGSRHVIDSHEPDLEISKFGR
jgi:hypothetical protein